MHALWGSSPHKDSSRLLHPFSVLIIILALILNLPATRMLSLEIVSWVFLTPYKPKLDSDTGAQLFHLQASHFQYYLSVNRKLKYPFC